MLNIPESCIYIYTYSYKYALCSKWNNEYSHHMLKDLPVKTFHIVKLETWVIDISIYIIIRYWVCLFFRYRNHLPVVQFQNQAHIRNPHGTGKVFKTIWGAPIFFSLAAVSQMGAEGGVEGTAPPEAEGNPAAGGCFASVYRIQIAKKTL